MFTIYVYITLLGTALFYNHKDTNGGLLEYLSATRNTEAGSHPTLQ